MPPSHEYTTRLLTSLNADDASERLKAALAIGSKPVPAFIEPLITRCAVEPDFFVRETLTWALIRHPAAATVPLLVKELESPLAQARSQALHTLSKFRDASAWPAITKPLLRDADDEVARSAWRAAVVLVPADQKTALAEELSTQLGRGERDLKLSLSRALVALGPFIEPILEKAMTHSDPLIQAHAKATERLLRDPNTAFELDMGLAKRAFVLGHEGDP